MNPHEMFRLAYLVQSLDRSNLAGGPRGPKPPTPNPRGHPPLPQALIA